MEGRKECRNETFKAKVVQQGLYTQMDEKKKEEEEKKNLRERIRWNNLGRHSAEK